jgi:Holliday junction resolvase RusA-like endonuclease
MVQRTRWKTKKIPGSFFAVIKLNRKFKKNGRDVDNFAKATLDLLASMQVIENDSFCEGLLIRWDARLPPDIDCSVTVTSIRSGIGKAEKLSHK